MSDTVRVLIVDDVDETREHLAKLIGFETDLEVVGGASSGVEALRIAAELQPDVVLLDINMPGMDGIATAEELGARVPGSAIIMMSVQGEPDYLRRSMLAGAREFLVKPFSSDELAASIRKVHARERPKAVHVQPASPSPPGWQPAPTQQASGRVVTLFSPKGGVGRTTIAVNLAVAAAQLGSRVALVDGSLQFGDVGVLLNLNPKAAKSIADVVREAADDEADALQGMLVDHSTGIRVLLAPPSPEMAELVTPQHLERIVAALKASHDLVIVDSWPWLHDTSLTFLDQSDVILALLTLEITNIKNMRLFLELVDQLGYAEENVQLVLNRSDSAYGIRLQDVEQSIGRRVHHTIVSDGRTVVLALNRGVPFVVGSPQAPVSKDVARLAQALRGEEETVTAAVEERPSTRKSLFAWR